ncbi:hypothetical protein [Oscillatoria acuminata]|uniref:DUF1574 domain-containing protein n=1 Tax=Oscillatoria acuminata PCC 6304 TaxID=56110 RepID=K9TPJ1_9CYAN|nr:hypothetical protein [Oscillatoria acuminata]AFY84298.1 hypothetical protein Oscil6304_4788 [Oscillatoria acuminata PCC 6304]
MVNTQELVQTNTGTTLTQWAAEALEVAGENIHLRFRGNTLHILWESESCPSMAIAVAKLTDALKKQGIDSLLPPDHPPIDEIFLYGRTLGTKRPDWSVRIESTHPHSPTPEDSPSSETGGPSCAELKPTQTPPTPPPPATENLPFSIADARMMLKVQSRASLGNPEAEALLAKGMARYLNETLSLYAISVKVLIRPLKRADRSQGDRPYPPRRLWIFCQSPNSPDATSLALPIAERLRELQLTGCSDAAILGRTTPDGKPELLLRVDLTPTVERLKNWARWGDIPAITRLLNQAVASRGLEVGVVQKDATLHLFCGNSTPEKDPTTDSPLAAADKSLCIDAIAPILNSLSPQGLHAVTLYGCRYGRQLDTPSNAPPLWVDWLDLPAARDPLLALSPRELATQGNLDALQFLLDRLVNPELDAKLNGNGLCVFLRQDPDLLHIMVEGSTCPEQDTLAPLVLEFLQELHLNGVEELRLYGRREGDKHPSWRYDTAIFYPSSLLSPEPELTLAAPEDPTPEPPEASAAELAEETPEPVIAFTHGDSDATEELPEAVESMFASDPPEELQACLSKQAIAPAPRERPSPGWVTRLCLLTGLFIPAKTFRRGPASSSKVAFIWGFLGLLVMLHTDWLLGHAALFSSSPTLETATVPGETPADPNPLPGTSPQQEFSFGELSRNPEANEEDPIFNGSSFTDFQEEQAIALNPETLPTFDYPTFNSQQLDEQLRLYLQYLATSGPPDVLIIGSSRALRGVAPMTIEESLSSRYPGLKVFNFGINGATAQVADFVVRELIPQEQLPKLILWADGARALNSGRSDRTFEAISRSPGYRHLLLGNRPRIPDMAKDDDASQSLSSLSETLVQRARTGLNIKENYETLDLWINEKLASVSANYEHRERLQGFLRGQLLLPLAETANHFIPEPARPSQEAIAETTTDSTFDSVEKSIIALQEESAALSNPDTLPPATLSNGFLPLSVRFNPLTYYEKHARVSGDYDADYESFQLAGIQTAAVTNLLEFTREHQIPLVFINMPLTQEYLDPVRLEYERQFQKYMLSLSLEKEGLSFRDLSQLWPTEIDRFSDPSHLNRYGAHEVSNRLSQDPMIPWPQTQ